MQSEPETEHRLEGRSNIFVIATLYTSGGSTPVRVRNLSGNGALVEANALPPPGSPIRLSRGSLTIPGEIIWVAGPKAGLHFSARVAVLDWLPNGKRASGQQLVDEVVHQARLGAIQKTTALDPQAICQGTPGATDELLRLRDLLERAGEELAADSSVAARHMMALQLIDGVAQALATLAAQP